MKTWLWGGEVRRVPRPPSRRVNGGLVVMFYFLEGLRGFVAWGVFLSLGWCLSEIYVLGGVSVDVSENEIFAGLSRVMGEPSQIVRATKVRC